jgi:hypothetical protein
VSNLNENPDRIVPDRPKLDIIQQQTAIIQQLQEQLAMLTGQAEGAPQGGAPQPQQPPANLQEDGSQVGGRESNFVSPRPNGY